MRRKLLALAATAIAVPSVIFAAVHSAGAASGSQQASKIPADKQAADAAHEAYLANARAQYAGVQPPSPGPLPTSGPYLLPNDLANTVQPFNSANSNEIADALEIDTSAEALVMKSGYTFRVLAGTSDGGAGAVLITGDPIDPCAHPDQNHLSRLITIAKTTHLRVSQVAQGLVDVTDQAGLQHTVDPATGDAH
jgi:hypothetical protein